MGKECGVPGIVRINLIDNMQFNNVKNNSFKAKIKRKFSNSQLKVTKMLLLVSTVFIILNLPSYVMRIYINVCILI